MFLDIEPVMSEVDEEKLNNLLRDYQVRISNRGRICLNDFIENVIESKNPKQYMKRLKYDKFIINDRTYIEPSDCVDLIQITNKKKCRIIYEQLEQDDNDTSSIIDVEEEIFQFQGHKFKAFFVELEDGDWNVWIKASDAARYLGYVNDKQAIREHVDGDNKLSFGKLSELFPMLLENIPKSMDYKTNYINMSGFMNLIHASKKPFAVDIKRWLDNEVVPNLIKYGVYIMQPAKIVINKIYNRNDVAKYSKKPVMYIIYIGKYDGIHLFKYGLSRDIMRRIYKEHVKHFDVCKVIYIEECANCEAVEKLFEKHMISLNLHREMVINDKNQTELFTVTTKYMHGEAVAKMTKLIAKNKLPEVAQADDKINILTNVVDIYKHSDEMQKLIIQFMQSDNYRFAVDANTQIAKLDSETKLRLRESDIELRNIELETERVRRSRVAMEQGIYNYDTERPSKVKLPPRNKSKPRSNIVVL